MNENASLPAALPQIEAAPSSWRRTCRLTLNWSVILFGPMTFVQACRTSCVGDYWYRSIFNLDGLAMLWAFIGVSVIAIVAVAFYVPTLTTKARFRSRRHIVVTSCLVCLLGCELYLTQAVRHHAIGIAVRRLDPVVDAVDRYYKEHGKPPGDLAELAPKYMDLVPHGIPKLEFHVYADNPASRRTWSAYFFVDFESTVDYNPQLEYYDLERGFNASPPRIGRWGYYKS